MHEFPHNFLMLIYACNILSKMLLIHRKKSSAKINSNVILTMHRRRFDQTAVAKNLQTFFLREENISDMFDIENIKNKAVKTMTNMYSTKKEKTFINFHNFEK